jgi:uncharacterized membrane protein (UPF0127 family)
VRRSTVLLVASLLATTVAASCGDVEDGPERETETLVFETRDASVPLEVEIADSPEERATGLMNRSSLPEDRGMAFRFEEPTTSGFWMKDTLIPLSIAFWDEEERIVDILDMEPCPSEPCPTYGPDVPYVGAVEVNVGWFERNGVRVGDRVELSSGDG